MPKSVKCGAEYFRVCGQPLEYPLETCHSSRGCHSTSRGTPNCQSNQSMATLIFWSNDLTRRHGLTKSSVDNLLTKVKRAEKATFAHTEALDFDIELKKQNTNLAVILDPFPQPSDAGITAYLVFARTQKTVLLHKICVLKRYRCRGIAKALLEMYLKHFKGLGCRKVQLWVDEANMPAKQLYTSVGFAEIDRVEGYYAPGRNGIKMIFDF